MKVDRLTHLGLSVSDLECSVRFYCEVLGCREVGRLSLSGQPTAQLNSMEDVRIDTVWLERDGWRLELIGFLRRSGRDDGDRIDRFREPRPGPPVRGNVSPCRGVDLTLPEVEAYSARAPVGSTSPHEHAGRGFVLRPVRLRDRCRPPSAVEEDARRGAALP